MTEIPLRGCGCPINAYHRADCPGAPRIVDRMERFPGGSIVELTDWAHQRGIWPSEVTVTACHLRWRSAETPEERERSERFKQETDARHERWEQDTNDRLRAKFETGPGEQ